MARLNDPIARIDGEQRQIPYSAVGRDDLADDVYLTETTVDASEYTDPADAVRDALDNDIPTVIFPPGSFGIPDLGPDDSTNQVLRLVGSGRDKTTLDISGNVHCSTDGSVFIAEDLEILGLSNTAGVIRYDAGTTGYLRRCDIDNTGEHMAVEIRDADRVTIEDCILRERTETGATARIYMDAVQNQIMGCRVEGELRIGGENNYAMFNTVNGLTDDGTGNFVPGDGSGNIDLSTA